MAVLMNVLKEELTTITTTAAASAAPRVTTTATTTMSRSIMTAVRQEATATTESSSILKEITTSEGSGVIPKAQVESVINGSSREMLSNALQQGIESLADPNTLDKVAPIAKP